MVNRYESKSSINNLTVYETIPDFMRILIVVLVQTNSEERTNKIPSKHIHFVCCVHGVTKIDSRGRRESGT